MEDIKKKVEALLFSSGRRMSIEELSKICRIAPDSLKAELGELQEEYKEKASSLMIVNEGEFWKLTTKEDYLHLVKNIVTKTELTKTLMETLAIIAFKYPIKQADLIKMRTNKAYDHISELEEMGYITRQKYGRTKLIKLTEKFFDYFSLPEDKLKEQFKDFEGLAEAIEEKEDEIKKIRSDQKKKAQETKKQEKSVELLDQEGNAVPLKLIDEEPEKIVAAEEASKVEVYEETVGNLEVVDVPQQIQKQSATKEKSEEPKGIELTDEMEEKVEERVQEILGLRGNNIMNQEAAEEETSKEKE